jgi:2-polyprenyl-3-methyl-5-hydroxy-6-metoxy-1,4-benzoquinol methylase
MKPDTTARLINLNRQFYQTFGVHFSKTRQRLQPGVLQILKSLDPNANILDLGCGNGELARTLAKMGHRGRYIGLDFNLQLLAEATQSNPENLEASFKQADISLPDWDENIPKITINVIMAFAVLHHLPGKQLHRHILSKIHTLLQPQGRFLHSEWQFLNSSRLRARVQPWETVGLSKRVVEQGDYLLDWRLGGYGLRYVHHFEEKELAALAKETGFTISNTFYSDGEGGRLGLYQIWEKG